MTHFNVLEYKRRSSVCRFSFHTSLTRRTVKLWRFVFSEWKRSDGGVCLLCYYLGVILEVSSAFSPSKMFKKLKDKLAEEVKISPQRIQQFTQSVTERIQSVSIDENLFSIGEDGSYFRFSNRVAHPFYYYSCDTLPSFVCVYFVNAE